MHDIAIHIECTDHSTTSYSTTTTTTTTKFSATTTKTDGRNRCVGLQGAISLNLDLDPCIPIHQLDSSKLSGLYLLIHFIHIINASDDCNFW